jgi:hypothetical protein
VSQVSAPVSTTVIASDIAGATAFGAAALEGFESIVAAARGMGFVTQESGRPNLTLTLSPDQDPGAPLEALARAAKGFDAAASPLRLRSMVHFGVVFRTESPEGVSYVGSAIRSTQSALRRAPPTGGFLATADFAAHATKRGGLSVGLQPFTEGAAVEGMCQIVFGGAPPAPGVAGNGAAGSGGGIDAVFLDFVKRRLAEEIGPFANALADRAVRGVTVPNQVLAVLGREIENPAARKKFEDDLLRFVKSRA